MHILVGGTNLIYNKTFYIVFLKPFFKHYINFIFFRRSRSRSPVRGGERGYDRSMGAPRERPDEYSRSRAPEHGSSRRPRGESPIRNAPAPPPPKYERHSPRRNYESSSRTDRSRRNDPAPIEDPQRSCKLFYKTARSQG